MKRILPALLLCSLLAASLDSQAREAQVLGFKFEIPDGWRIEGGGPTGDVLFATGSVTGKAYAPPIVMANACMLSNPECSTANLPDPTKDLGGQGCANAIRQASTWRGMIHETRWVCETEQLSDGPVTFGASIFRINGAILYMGYLTSWGPDDVSRFLDGLAQSLTVTTTGS